MHRNQKVAVVGGLLAIGVVAALPFSRSPVTPAPGASSGQSGFLMHEIPLQLPAQSGMSPAIGLHDDDPASVRPAVVAPTIERNRLEGNGLPPELPDNYHSLMTSPLPEGTGARRLADPPRPGGDLSLAEPRVRDAPPLPPPVVKAAPPRERQHRIVDGDTLARLAERYWGDAALADVLYAANRDVLATPDPLPLGVTMKIPAAPQQQRPQVNLEPSLELVAPVRQPSIDNGESLPLAPIPAGALGNSRP